MKLHDMAKLLGYDLSDPHTFVVTERISRKGNHIVYFSTWWEADNFGIDYWGTPEVDTYEQESVFIIVDNDDNVLNEGEVRKQEFGW